MSWLKYIQLKLNLHGVFLDCSEQQLKEWSWTSSVMLQLLFIPQSVQEYAEVD